MAEAAFKPVGFMGPQIFGLPVDRDILFSNHKDIYKKRVEKRQRKLIVKISFFKLFDNFYKISFSFDTCSFYSAFNT